MEDSIDNSKPPSGGLKMEICFIIFGIGSLLGWNAILSDINIYYKFHKIIYLYSITTIFRYIFFYKLSKQI